MKPNFIGIGVQKGGTSWLHRQFIAHPEVFIPENRKEIHFFDEYHDRGANWYEAFFNKADGHKAIGEITPNYIYDMPTAERIASNYPDVQLIIMLRHPVKRAYSHYTMMFQSGQGQEYADFNDFMERYPHGKNRGLYASQLTRWLEYFPQDQLLVLISEEIFSGEEGLDRGFQQIGDFLGINPALFDRELAQERVGKARPAPKYPAFAKLSQHVRLWLRDHDMDFVASFFKKLGVTRQVFGQSHQPVPPLKPEDLTKWTDFYRDEISALEKILGRPLKEWA